jgi:hypothetical protein
MSASLQDAIKRCVGDYTELPPVPGRHYAAFVVHPRSPGPLVLAIAHKEGGQFVVDLVRGGLTLPQAAKLVTAYGIGRVAVADDEGDSSFSLAHAVAGSIEVLRGTA